MKKVILGLSFLSSVLLSDSVVLKKGWNLIGISSTFKANTLSKYTSIISATGGGVGGGANFSYDKEYPDFSTGSLKLGQGYWIRVSSDMTLEYTKESNIPSSVNLKQGWNLIHPFSMLKAEELKKYSNIISATGGGVGGGANFSYDKEYPDFSTGETKIGQGYWINVSENMVLAFALNFSNIAWGIGGDTDSSQAVLRINGITYTVIPYSKLSIDQSNASLKGDFSLLKGTALTKNVPQMKINSDYINQEVKLKFYASDKTFNDTTLIKTSDVILVKNSVTNYVNIEFNNPNDYSVPQESGISVSNLPPKSPTF